MPCQKKRIWGLHKTYYEMPRGRIKGKKREGSSWFEECTKMYKIGWKRNGLCVNIVFFWLLTFTSLFPVFSSNSISNSSSRTGVLCSVCMSKCQQLELDHGSQGPCAHGMVPAAGITGVFTQCLGAHQARQDSERDENLRSYVLWSQVWAGYQVCELTIGLGAGY